MVSSNPVCLLDLCLVAADRHQDYEAIVNNLFVRYVLLLVSLLPGNTGASGNDGNVFGFLTCNVQNLTDD